MSLIYLWKTVIEVRFLAKLLDEKTGNYINSNELSYNLIYLFGTLKSTLNNIINQSSCF
ncbi:hypothetical protein [Tenacibaculum ascidiaceicola]|uniref:hypothetical protein n=1 Tax=Tenacibaculum ascidiaceicola TaxID=1699411 RepID=UPI0038950087